jgi:predicted aldo/keto reductase-like oxidoreductase
MICGMPRSLGEPIASAEPDSVLADHPRHPGAEHRPRSGGSVAVVIERAEFGRTRHESSRAIFGAAALSRMSQERADELLPILLELGVNHLDVAAAYGDAELRMAPWLAEHRSDFFLATKTGDRVGTDARSSLERSLERLGVDQIDLIQLHNLVEEDEWQVAHGPGGAIEALDQARQEGLVRFIGVTGHGLRIVRMHLRSLERFDFDSVLFPYNFSLLADDAYRADVEELLAVCDERRIATQTIKSVARRRWVDDAQPHFSWYEPLPAGPALQRAVQYVLARPQLFLITSSDAGLLRPILEAASSPVSRPSDARLRDDWVAQDVQPLFDGAALERI